MGHVFQVEWWEKHPSGCHFWFIIAKGIGNRIGKGKEALIDILFMKIKEYRRKGRRKVTGEHQYCSKNAATPGLPTLLLSTW